MKQRYNPGDAFLTYTPDGSALELVEIVSVYKRQDETYLYRIRGKNILMAEHDIDDMERLLCVSF